MIYKRFDGIKLSRLGMGNMRLPVKDDIEGKPIDYDKAQEIIDYAMAHGVNYYDTAYVYHSGESEAFLGAALKKYPRESYYIATKFNLAANPDYRAVFEEQLSRLQTNHIDFYLLHAIMDKNYQSYFDSGCIAYFEEQQRLGRIRYLGFSSHASPNVLDRFAGIRNWDFAQLQINYFDWIFDTSAKEYEVLRKHNIPIMVMEPVRGGRLASLSPAAEETLRAAHPDWSMASWAFRWLMRLPQILVILSGMSNMEQIIDNIRTFESEGALNDGEAEKLVKAAEIFKKHIQVPCTSCRYCCDDCPARINIPAVLGVYNTYKLDGRFALKGLKNIESDGQPSDCIACGACCPHCPQNIDITGIMTELKELTRE